MDRLISYCSKYPDLEIQDLFKYIYQSCFGCGHFSGSFACALNQIQKELQTAPSDILPETELLSGDYGRIHLKYLKRGLSPETFCRLFLLSSQNEPFGNQRLSDALEVLSRSAKNKQVPFSEKEVESAIRQWAKTGFQPCHHSDSFKNHYHPSYRVIKKTFLPLLPLLTEIDKAVQRQDTIHIAIDGRCAAGKTTVASILGQIYNCNIYHMDDFFLLPEKRTPDRLHTPGGNIDYERFLEEVLLPSKQGQQVHYRRYNCSTQNFEPAIKILPCPINITEGSYSLHPALSDLYDVKIFMDISPELQRQRIAVRNQENSDRFFQEWIPMEEAYFETCNIRQLCSLILNLS